MAYIRPPNSRFANYPGHPALPQSTFGISIDANGEVWSYQPPDMVSLGAMGGGGSAPVTPTPPSSPQQGDLWFDSSTGNLMIWNGSTWVPTMTMSGDFLPITGGTVTGMTSFTGGLTASNLGVTGSTTTGSLNVSGASTLHATSIIGALTLSQNATANMQATTLGQVNTLIGAAVAGIDLSGYLPLSGGTLTNPGTLTLNGGLRVNTTGDPLTMPWDPLIPLAHGIDISNGAQQVGINYFWLAAFNTHSMIYVAGRTTADVGQHVFRTNGVARLWVQETCSFNANLEITNAPVAMLTMGGATGQSARINLNRTGGSQFADLSFQSSGSNRWRIEGTQSGADGASGPNTNSTFNLFRFADNGTTNLDAPNPLLSIARATGAAIYNGSAWTFASQTGVTIRAPTVGSSLLTIDGNPHAGMNLNRVGGTGQANIYTQLNGVTEWRLFFNGTDFQIIRFNNTNGAQLGAGPAFRIDRLTGHTNIPGGINIGFNAASDPDLDSGVQFTTTTTVLGIGLAARNVVGLWTLDFINKQPAGAFRFMGGALGTTELLHIDTSNLRVLLPNLPTSAAGLPAGALWRNGNVVNIV